MTPTLTIYKSIGDYNSLSEFHNMLVSQHAFNPLQIQTGNIKYKKLKYLARLKASHPVSFKLVCAFNLLFFKNN